MFRERHYEDTDAVEGALASLKPAPSGVDRDILMFSAGQASAPARRFGVLWPLATSGALLAAVILGIALLTQAPQRVIEKTVFVPVESARPAARAYAEARPALWAREQPWPRGNYLELRQKVLAGGLDALPRPEPTRAGARKETVEELLGISFSRLPAPDHFWMNVRTDRESRL